MSFGNITTNFFTVCNKFYEPFVLPYIVSVLHHNDDACVEIGVENQERFEERNANSLNTINKLYGDRMHFFSADFEKTKVANSLRFLEEPSFKTQYTYIGDIDILILENVTKIHVENMKKTGLKFSNIIRPNNKKALSGLHFTETDAFYPQKIFRDEVITLDEALLYELVNNSGLQLPPENEKFRPLHGFHLSLNRRPDGRKASWGLNKNYVQKFLLFKQSENWQEILPHLEKEYLRIYSVLNFCLEIKFPEIFHISEEEKINSKILFS